MDIPPIVVPTQVDQEADMQAVNSSLTLYPSELAQIVVGNIDSDFDRGCCNGCQDGRLALSDYLFLLGLLYFD